MRLFERNDLAWVHNTLNQLGKQMDLRGMMLHSDQGFQYTSKLFNCTLKQFCVLGNHFRRRNCLDNACIDFFFSHLKTEKIYLQQATNQADVKQQVNEYIEFYNHYRFLKKLNNRSPVEYRETVVA